MKSIFHGNSMEFFLQASGTLLNLLEPSNHLLSLSSQDQEVINIREKSYHSLFILLRELHRAILALWPLIGPPYKGPLSGPLIVHPYGGYVSNRETYEKTKNA